MNFFIKVVIRMKCRGLKRKDEIIAKYTISPIIHLRLMNKQKIFSDAGGTISDSYFIFLCINKNDKSDIRYIQCGKPTAQYFCNATDNELPRLFNPLIEDNENYNSNDNNMQFNHTNYKLTICEERKQLLDIIALIMCAWGFDPQKPLAKIYYEIKRDSDKKMPNYYLKSVNTILINGKTTFTEVVNKLKKDNQLKKYNFDLIFQKAEKLFEDNRLK